MTDDPMVLRDLGLESRRLHPFEKTALWICLAATVLAFCVSLGEANRYAGIDLRNRVVGARVMLAGHDPYTFEWHTGMPLELLDPVEEEYNHRLTAAPPTLLLYLPLAPLPYKVGRLVHCLLEWAALIVSVALLAGTIQDHRQRVVFLVVATVFFILGDFWRMHTERGQVYVFHLLALAGACGLCLRQRLDSLGAGLLFGVAALMRPTYLLIPPAFLVIRSWRTGLGGCLMFIAGLLATVPWLPREAWQSFSRTGDRCYVSLGAPESLQKRPPCEFDVGQGLIEGVDFRKFVFGVSSTSVPYLYAKLRRVGLVPSCDIGLLSKGCMLLLALGLYALLFARRQPPPPPRLTLALIMVFALDTEFFLPHRWGYVDVMLLLPLALLWPFLWRQPAVFGVILLAVLIGLCLHPQLSVYMATLLRSWLVMGCLTMLAIREWLRGGGDPESPEPRVA